MKQIKFLVEVSAKSGAFLGAGNFAFPRVRGRTTGGGRRKKSFVFTMDALIAVLLALFVLTAFSAISSIQPLSSVSLQKQARDVLTLADKNGTLRQLLGENSSQGNSTMQGFLSSAVPSNYGYSVNVSIYNYAGAGNFSFSKGFVFVVRNETETPEKAVARRVFVNGSQGLYGVAKMELWRSSG